jgi:hypothetical protein
MPVVATPQSAFAQTGVLLDRPVKITVEVLRAFARSVLCAGNAEADCSEALRQSARLLAGVHPGEKLRSRGNVKSVLLTR